MSRFSTALTPRAGSLEYAANKSQIIEAAMTFKIYGRTAWSEASQLRLRRHSVRKNAIDKMRNHSVPVSDFHPPAPQQCTEDQQYSTSEARPATMEYSTLSARLATFEPPTKRSKAGWPHKRPSAKAVAQAGFYYSPQSTGSDNVVCYLCDRYLDGWEEDDDPVEEHLKHSPECGWAIMMGIAREDKYDVTEMDDPTSTSMAEARRATFAANWPHESKRGWTCKTEKMVEAGWHFAPTDESEDWVTCAYCKLSLDGWEPKDNPFDEHYKRAPECVFFHFAGTTAPSKRPKAKKARSSKAARTSKASAARVSTQSAVSLQPEEVTINDVPDLDESIDTSTTSVVSTLSTTANRTPVSTPASARHDHDRLPWTPVDVDLVFRSDPSDPIFQAAESFLMVDGALDEEEKKMTVQEWIYHLAARAEEELKLESERVVGVFAREGARAMQVLEDLECA
ncbi:hypothetical protein DV738_g1578, partial [Chaetothyriales sp. CBS 135597]